MKNSDVLKLNELIQKILKKSQVVKFNHKLIKNRNVIKINVESLEEVRKFDDEKYGEFENKRIQLCVKYCDKDVEGKPIIVNNVFRGLDKSKDFYTELTQLNEEYSESINNYRKKDSDINSLLNEQCQENFNWEKIDVDLIPDGVVDGEELEFLITVGIIE